MGETASVKSQDPAEEEKAKPSTSKNRYDLDLILDISLDVRVELGQVKMMVSDLLQLGQGSVIDLKKPVGEQLDIYIGDKLIARGEVVVADEKLGIRVTDIVSPAERVRSLG
jgi:flagellar motor switch protein FliN/FliY